MSAKELDPVARYAVGTPSLKFTLQVMDVDNQYNPIPLDLTGQTAINLRFTKPDGSSVLVAGSPADPAELTNGTVMAILPSADDPDPVLTLDQKGIWQYITKIDFPAGRQIISTDPQVFYVV